MQRIWIVRGLSILLAWSGASVAPAMNWCVRAGDTACSTGGLPASAPICQPHVITTRPIEAQDSLSPLKGKQNIIVIPTYRGEGILAKQGEDHTYLNRLVDVLARDRELAAGTAIITLFNGEMPAPWNPDKVEIFPHARRLAPADIIGLESSGKGLGQVLPGCFQALSDQVSESDWSGRPRMMLRFDVAENPPELIPKMRDVFWAAEGRAVVVANLKYQDGMLGPDDERAEREFQALRPRYRLDMDPFSNVHGYWLAPLDLMPHLMQRFQQIKAKADSYGPEPVRWGMELTMFLAARSLGLPVRSVDVAAEVPRMRDPKKVDAQIDAWTRVSRAYADLRDNQQFGDIR